MIDSHQLLAEYVRSGSDEVFRELVGRYVDLVYSTALRLVAGDSHRAEDVVQMVFLDLAAKASTLPASVMLGGWLHRHTCFMAAKTMRGERRRVFRERQAVEMDALQNDPAPDLSGIAPVLDEAINELGDTDREAIVLRFYEQRDFRSVGLALGSNEDAARMRVARALEKLETLLKRRGLTASAALLAASLLTNAVQAAPAGLVATISTAAALAGSTGSIATVAKTIAMTTFQKTVVVATLAVAIGAGIHQAGNAIRSRGELEAVRQQQQPLKDQLGRFAREQEEMAAQLAALRAENEQLRKDRAELARLRAETSRLRGDAQELARLKAGDAGDPTTLAAVSWQERVGLLKQHLANNPATTIGELKYLTEEDWLDATRDKLETERDYRQAASNLRHAAENRFASTLQPALRKYMEANDGKFPTDLAQLQPYFASSVDEAILQRYAILPREALSNLGMGGDWIITQRAPVDVEFDNRSGIGPNGWGSAGTQAWDDSPKGGIYQTLGPVVAAYAAANGGKEPFNPADLLPYLKTAEQRAAYDKAVKAMGSDKVQ